MKKIVHVKKTEETELILRLKEGDHKAFETLYCLYKNKLLFFLEHKFGLIEEAEDIVQEVFIKIWNEKDDIDKINNFNAYLFKIAKNSMIDYIRKYSKKNIMPLDIIDNNDSSIGTKETPETILMKQERQQIFQELINQLPPQQKKIYKLRYEQEKTVKNIAIEMNISFSAVQNAINKAHKNICKYFVKRRYF
jgi:RNA polymerase sigma-70 factor (ECF subfamily)